MTNHCGQRPGTLRGVRPRGHAHSGVWGQSLPYPINTKAQESRRGHSLKHNQGAVTRERGYHYPLCSICSFRSARHPSPPGLCAGIISISSLSSGFWLGLVNRRHQQESQVREYLHLPPCWSTSWQQLYRCNEDSSSWINFYNQLQILFQFC